MIAAGRFLRSVASVPGRSVASVASVAGGAGGAGGAATSLRTHSCGALRENHAGSTVRLSGWVSRVRPIGADLVFVTLRDAFGTTQVMVAGDPHLVTAAKALKPETVLQIDGTVSLRPLKMRNKEMATGMIEVAASALSVLNTSLPLPFPIDNDKSSFNLAQEALRLRHRYVDLRRDELQRVLRLRSLVAHAARGYLADEHGFVEVETPTLFKRTPGGAAEFPVPTRDPGLFYSLVQSPQQFKQLLMVGGIDRYYQFARCYRDESGRGDRQPEFTQIDMEMSFASQKEIQDIVEGLVRRMWASAAQQPGLPHVPAPPAHIFRLTFADAMRRFGSDKPDMRFGMELVDIAATVSASATSTAAEVAAATGALRPTMEAVALAFVVDATFLDSDVVALLAEAAKLGEGGTGIVRVHVRRAEQCEPAVRDACAASPASVVVTGAGPYLATAQMLGKLRLAAATLVEARGTVLRRPDDFRFLWVEDFPLFERDEATGRLQASHHPFTAPVAADAPHLWTQPLRVRGQHFDLVVNGVELGGGSVRVHNAATQERILGDVLGEDVALFAQLLEGLRYGAPPHGGLALGFDRVMMVLCNAASLRDVLAFPKSFAGKDLMANVPGPLPAADLALYHLRGAASTPPERRIE